MAQSIKALCAKARKRAFDDAGGDLQRKATLRSEAPPSPVYPNQPTGYYRLFCCHGRPMWDLCSASTCRRDRAEAERNAARLRNGTL